MYRTLIATFVIFSFFLVNTSAQDEDFSEEMKMAEAHRVSGDITRALVVLEDILIKAPNNLPAQEKKIEILTQNDREKEAFKDIEEYISLYPSEPVFYYLRGLLNMQKEKYSKAIEDFDNCVQMGGNPDWNAKLYLNRGIAYYKNGDYELAEADFDEVIALEPRNAGAYHGKGMVKYELNLYEEAVTEFLKALKIDEKNAIAHFNLAMSYFRLDEKDKACYHFNKSCDLKNRNACRLFMMECDINVPE